MPLIGSQNPWLAGAQGLDSGGNALAQTLLQIPEMRQRLGLGALQGQLMQGQISQLPLQGQLLQADAASKQAQGQEFLAHGQEYQQHGRLYQTQADEQQTANDSLGKVQDLLKIVGTSMAQGHPVDPNVQGALVSASAGLSKDAKAQLWETTIGALGMANKAVAGNTGVQTAAALGDHAFGQGVNIPEGGTHLNLATGQTTPGMVNLAPEHQLFVPQQRTPGMSPMFGNPQFGAPAANNPNASPSASKSGALARTVLSAIMQKDPGADPMAALSTINKLFPGEVPGLTVEANGAPIMAPQMQPTQGQPVKVESAEQYKALPNGASYIDASGHLKIKGK